MTITTAINLAKHDKIRGVYAPPKGVTTPQHIAYCEEYFKDAPSKKFSKNLKKRVTKA